MLIIQITFVPKKNSLPITKEIPKNFSHIKGVHVLIQQNVDISVNYCYKDTIYYNKVELQVWRLKSCRNNTYR